MSPLAVLAAEADRARQMDEQYMQLLVLLHNVLAGVIPAAWVTVNLMAKSWEIKPPEQQGAES